MIKNNSCSICSSCTAVNCRDRVTNDDRSKQTFRSFVSSIVISLGIANIFTVIALYIFITGSVRKSNSWSDAWDAYYCSQAVLPTSVLLTITAVAWLIALWVLCFKCKV